MAGQCLQIQDLTALGLDLLQNARLGASGGAADDEEVELFSQVPGIFHHMIAKCLVAAFNPVGGPADLAKNHLHGAAALATAPAVDQRAPFLGLVQHLLFDVARDIPRNHGSAHLLGLEGRDLLVGGANHHPLFVAQDWKIDSTRDVVEGKFCRRTHVDYHVVAVEGRGGNQPVVFHGKPHFR